MTRAELQALVDRIPASVLDDHDGELALTFDDLNALSRVVMELANRLGDLSQDWMRRTRRDVFG